MPRALPVRVIPDPRAPGHISDEFFITLTSWKAANSAFVGGFAVGWLAYTDSFFRSQGPRSEPIDSWVSGLATFSAFLSLASAAIYSLSAVGTMWQMKVAAGWELFSKDREPPTPLFEGNVVPEGSSNLESAAILWYDAIFILAPLPLMFSIAIFIFVGGSICIRILLCLLAGICLVPWVWRLILGIRSLWGTRKHANYDELVDITALPEALAQYKRAAAAARSRPSSLATRSGDNNIES